jgi:hypothetical protein
MTDGKENTDDGEDNVATEQKVAKRRASLGLHVLAIHTLRLVQQLSTSVMGGVRSTNGKKWPTSDKVW